MIVRTLVFVLSVIGVLATSRGATFYCDPATGSAQGDGGIERPWRTVEEVLSAGLIQLCDRDGKPVKADAPVKPGDTLLLRSGWHGVIRIPRGYNDRPITIAADKGQTPEVGWVEIGEGRNWLIKGLTVSPSLAPRPLERLPRNLVTLGERGGQQSAELVVEDCFIYSALDTSAWTGKDWVQKPASGIWLGRHGKRHVARNNYILNTRFGINLCAPDCLVEKNVVCVNHWHGITLGDAQSCTIQDNSVFSRWAGKARPWVMLGQKKNQARGNTVRGNLAHSFSFKADPEVKAENNREVTEAAFHQKLAELAASIDAKFGKLHPTAKRPRLEPEAAQR